MSIVAALTLLFWAGYCAWLRKGETANGIPETKQYDYDD
jgi:hypothetical protein